MVILIQSGTEIHAQWLEPNRSRGGPWTWDRLSISPGLLWPIELTTVRRPYTTWASCQICKIACCACAGNARNVSLPSRVSDPDMHQGTCLMHVPYCMLGSLTSGFPWSRWRRKCSRHSRCMRKPQFCVFGKSPIKYIYWFISIHINHTRIFIRIWIRAYNFCFYI